MRECLSNDPNTFILKCVVVVWTLDNDSHVGSKYTPLTKIMGDCFQPLKEHIYLVLMCIFTHALFI